MDLAETLRRAIDQRCQALADRIAELRGEVADDRLAIASVLDLFAFYPYALGQVVGEEWRRNPSVDSRIQLLRPFLRQLTEVSTFVDEWLSRSNASAVPLHLLDALEQACLSVGLGPRRAMIAEGQANNFTTVDTELSSVLFGQLGPLCPPVPAELIQPLALMRAPRFEGSLVRWHPILLGHELAHIVATQNDSLALLDLASSFDRARASTIVPPGGRVAGPAGALRILEICEHWALELICDAFAVQAFGPAGVAALGDFLEVIGATDLLTDTHPPGRLRVQMLVGWLGPVVDSRLDAIVEPWRSLAVDPIVYGEPWAQFACETLLARAADILRVVQSWQPRYEFDSRTEVIRESVRALSLGMPPEPTAVVASGRHAVLPADVISAAWISWVEEAALPTDQLAAKSLADLEFLRRWGDAGGAWQVPQPITAIAETEGAILSALELSARLHTQPNDRLVVTPLLPDFAAGASLDLRLGNRFVVFVRSRISSFDSLVHDRDPRQMQRSMQLGWGDTFVLHPGELVLAATLEYLVLPGDLTAQVLSRSSYGRLGLLSATAVQVHPHFHGCLTLELVNLGTVPLVLTPGERIAQLVVSTTTSSAKPSSSKYHCPIGPEFSKVRTDRESDVLRGIR